MSDLEALKKQTVEERRKLEERLNIATQNAIQNLEERLKPHLNALEPLQKECAKIGHDGRLIYSERTFDIVDNRVTVLHLLCQRCKAYFTEEK